jgi:tyrosyl-tRNA synthetase
MQLAAEIVSRFHGHGAADKAKNSFISRFQKGLLPEEIPERQVPSADGSISIALLLKRSDLTASTSEARRMIQQGAVRVEGERLNDVNWEIRAGASLVIQVGKRRFARVTVV